MELHKRTAEAFINYLKQHGYPDESIVLEWGDNNNRIDIAILDETRENPVAIYEIKGTKDMNSIMRGLSQLAKYQTFIGYPVDMSLVFSKDESPYFEVYNANDYIDYRKKGEIRSRFISGKFILERELISYKNISNSAEPKLKVKQRIRKEKYRDRLKIACWVIMGPLTIILLLLNRYGYYNFTTERLVVLGALVIIVLIPFFNEIRFKDVILKRNKGNSAEDANRE